MNELLKEKVKEKLGNKLLLGVDIGTNESKGILIDKSFLPVAHFSVPHTIENPSPGFFEMDAEIWWSDFCKITQILMKEANAKPEDIAGVGTSVMGCDCIPVDENCKPLRKAILYGIDARSGPQIHHLTEQYGEKTVYDMFGRMPGSDDISTKILWIRDNEPEIYQKAYKFLTGSSFMTAKLTGNFTIDSYLAKGAFRPIYTQEGSFDEKYGPLFCRYDQMAKCQSVVSLAGRVSKTASEECGLKEGTPVITGTGDSTAESIAGGLLKPGTLFVQYGSTMFFIYLVQNSMPAVNEGEFHFSGSNPYTIPDSYAVAGGTNCCGTLTKWVRDTFYADEVKASQTTGIDAYEVMAKEASSVAPGSDGLIILPYFYGERSPIYDPESRGMIFGLTGSHGRKEINRAALEAGAYSLGSHVEMFKALGLDPDTVIISGGGTKNPAWMQITADVLGKSVQVAEEWQTASYGDACMAAIGCGVLKDFNELNEVIPKGHIVQPDMDIHQLYNHYLKIYEALYSSTKELMHQL